MMCCTQAKILVHVIAEGIGMVRAEIGLNAAQGKVHLGQLPGGGVGFLAVNGKVADATTGRSMNSSLCTNMPEEPQQGS
jgi:hypothetical protein